MKSHSFKKKITQQDISEHFESILNSLFLNDKYLKQKKVPAKLFNKAMLSYQKSIKEKRTSFDIQKPFSLFKKDLTFYIKDGEIHVKKNPLSLVQIKYQYMTYRSFDFVKKKKLLVFFNNIKMIFSLTSHNEFKLQLKDTLLDQKKNSPIIIYSMKDKKIIAILSLDENTVLENLKMQAYSIVYEKKNIFFDFSLE